MLYLQLSACRAVRREGRADHPFPCPGAVSDLCKTPGTGQLSAGLVRSFNVMSVPMCEVALLLCGWALAIVLFLAHGVPLPAGRAGWPLVPTRASNRRRTAGLTVCGPCLRPAVSQVPLGLKPLRALSLFITFITVCFRAFLARHSRPYFRRRRLNASRQALMLHHTPARGIARRIAVGIATPECEETGDARDSIYLVCADRNLRVGRGIYRRNPTPQK